MRVQLSQGFFTLKTMALPNHNADVQDLPVKDMVLQRLPFLLDNPANTLKLSIFTYEVMAELEVCFRVSELPDGTIVPENIGDESKYSVLQRSIVADLVAIYILMFLGIGGHGDGSTGVVSSIGLTTFLKRAKAGSAEAEYEQFDMRKDTATLLIGTKDMITSFTMLAIRKAHTLGCIIDINNDGQLIIELILNRTPIIPFIHISSCGGCGC